MVYNIRHGMEIHGEHVGSRKIGQSRQTFLNKIGNKADSEVICSIPCGYFQKVECSSSNKSRSYREIFCPEFSI